MASLPLPTPVPLPIPRPVVAPPVPREPVDNEPDSDPFLLIPTHSGPGISRRSLTRVAGWLAWGSLALALILPLLILGVSERWWVSAALVYLPRQPWLIPPLLAVVATALWNRQALALAAVALVGTAGPVMGLSLGNFPGGLFAADAPATAPGSIRVVSANVQAFKPDFPALFAEIGRLSPDVVVFQEAFGDHHLVADLFEGWHVLREEEYVVASRWPVEKLGLCESATFDRNCAYAARVKHPQGDFAVGNIHFATARFGLQRLSPSAILTGVGPEELSEHITGERPKRWPRGLGWKNCAAICPGGRRRFQHAGRKQHPGERVRRPAQHLHRSGTGLRLHRAEQNADLADAHTVEPRRPCAGLGRMDDPRGGYGHGERVGPQAGVGDRRAADGAVTLIRCGAWSRHAAMNGRVCLSGVGAALLTFSRSR